MGASGIMARAPWGLSYADVVYEYPLYRKGDTRLTAVFSDLVPDAVGPIRSARIGNVWLREEWDGAFIFFHAFGAMKAAVMVIGGILVYNGASNLWIESRYRKLD